jgi:hypothetical protein
MVISDTPYNWIQRRSLWTNTAKYARLGLDRDEC